MGNHETEETGDGWLRGGVGWLVVVAVVVVRGGVYRFGDIGLSGRDRRRGVMGV